MCLLATKIPKFREKIRKTQSHQKNNVDKRQRLVEFNRGEHVFLKVHLIWVCKEYLGQRSLNQDILDYSGYLDISVQWHII
jgi:hypothetical protein